MSKARDALVNYFQYSNDADKQKRLWHSDSKWKKRIKEDLAKGRPVLYAGSNFWGNKGHAFVCDGYDSDDYFYFNFGWTGNYDGRFTIDDLTPEDYNYNYRQRAIFYLHPKNNQNYCNFTLQLADHFSCNCLDGAPPHENIPYTLTALESVPETYSAAWRTVYSGQNVTYKAHQSITLRPGFHVQAGATFTARTEPCRNCQGNIRSNGLLITDAQTDETTKAADTFFYTQKILEPRNNLAVDFDFNIYPNPNDGNFTIVLDTEDVHPFHVEIFNSSGISVFASEYCDTDQAYINCTNLQQGVYYVKVLMGNNVLSKRTVIRYD